jgi:hypothetical protein
MRYLAITLAMLSGSAFGAEDCSKINDKDDRLACYDREFPVPESSVVADEVVADEVVPEEVITEEVVPERVAPPPTPGTTDAAATAVTGVAVTGKETAVSPEETNVTPVPKSESEPSWFQRWFQKKTPDYTSTVKDVMNGDQQKMVFLLSNNQIWIQNSPRNLPIREGDEVTIKKGSVGGYILRNSSGTSTRVSRIN